MLPEPSLPLMVDGANFDLQRFSCVVDVDALVERSNHILANGKDVHLGFIHVASHYHAASARYTDARPIWSSRAIAAGRMPPSRSSFTLLGSIDAGRPL